MVVFAECNGMDVIHGVEIKKVHGAPAHIIESFHKAIEVGEQVNGQSLLESTYEKIGKGACGAVYALDHEYVLKVSFDNGRFSALCLDGEVLEELQGLPLVPTLYAYSTNNKYTLVQRIQGVNVGSIYGSDYEFESFDLEHWKQLCKDFFEGSQERGWIPNDLHSQNCMIDHTGNFWVIDFGLFKRDAKETFSCDVHDLINHCKDIHYYVGSKKKFAEIKKAKGHQYVNFANSF